ncbi:MAG TPA: pantetheine-phosphate adenylyltransferase [Bacteroidales bacterium]|nr:pantetheine-phosphate adenylyltransferase [Bacteroidales bacterium]HNV94872.1 pantetheine-phosphate adenylyltransferase [Bacteroidales bacterium]HOU97282.1 pantetheine-phosphate adenylyltransferase [Bacteroidales bacterium]
MNKTAVFPGSFDPITKGHESVIRRALPLFDKLYIAIGINEEKKTPYFPIEKRLKWIKQVFANEPKIEVVTYQGLTVDFCKNIGASFILRGLRTSADFEYERAIAQTNRFLNNGIETVFMLTVPEFTPINSTIVREILKYGGDASRFVPEGINLYE